MAIVSRYTKGYPDPTKLSAYSSNSHEARSQVKCSMFNIAAGNGDSIGSQYYLARIPSHAMLLPHSTVYSGGIAGLTSLNVGISNRIGTTLAAALMSAVDVHTAGSFALMSNVSPVNYNMRLWQLLGLASDPKADLDIVAGLLAATTGNGVLLGHIYWTVFGF